MEKVIENGCILIPRKEYEELMEKNRMLQKEVDNKDLKIDVKFVIKHREHEYWNYPSINSYPSINISDSTTFSVSDGLKWKIRKFIHYFLKRYCIEYENGDKRVRSATNEIWKTYIKQEFEKENLSFLEKIIYGKTLKHINNIIKRIEE